MVTARTLRVNDRRGRATPGLSTHFLAVLINFALELAFGVFVGRDDSRGWDSDSRGWEIRHGGSCEWKLWFGILDTALGSIDSRGWESDGRRLVATVKKNDLFAGV
jgi:hypothetical protein